MYPKDPDSTIHVSQASVRTAGESEDAAVDAWLEAGCWLSVKAFDSKRSFKTCNSNTIIVPLQ